MSGRKKSFVRPDDTSFEGLRKTLHSDHPLVSFVGNTLYSLRSDLDAMILADQMNYVKLPDETNASIKELTES